MRRKRARSSRSTALSAPELGYLSRPEERIVAGVLGKYAAEHGRLEAALGLPDLTPGQGRVLERALTDLQAQARREILAAVRLHRAAQE